MASSYVRQVSSGDYFSIPSFTPRSKNLAPSLVYWDAKEYSKFSLGSSDSIIPSPASPDSIYFLPKAYPFPELYNGAIEIDEVLDSLTCANFMQLEDAAEINMDLSLDRFFSDSQLENTFLPSTAGLYTQTDPISARLQPTNTMMPNTIYNQALVFGKDPIVKGHLFETPTVNTTPATETQSRKLFYNIHAQQSSYSVAQVNGPVTRRTTPAALGTGFSSIQESKLRSIAMPSTSYTSPTPSSSSSGSPPLIVTWSSQRKRKSSDSNDKDKYDECPLKRRRNHRRHHAPANKTPHKIIEKRYRTNLNDKIAALRDCVPSLRVTSNAKIKSAKKEKRDIADNLQGLSPAHNLNKVRVLFFYILCNSLILFSFDELLSASLIVVLTENLQHNHQATVLSKATKYILDLEKRNKALCEENAAYKDRIEAFKIPMLTNKNCNTITTTTANTPPMLATFTSSPGSSHSGSGSFDSTISATSLNECGIEEAGNWEGGGCSSGGEEYE
ncbi:hypothetical protein B7463_g12242, partial [Scytalidium lignicola]